MGHDHLLRLGCDARGKGRRNGAERGKKSATSDRAWLHVAKALVRRAFCLESRPGVRRLACPGFCAPSTARPVKPAGRDSPRHQEIRWSPRAASSGQHEQSESRSDESTQVSVAPRSCVSPLPRGVHRKQCSGAHECVQSTRPEAPSAPHPFGNSEACSVAFRLHSRNALPSELRRHRSGRAHGPSG